MRIRKSFAALIVAGLVPLTAACGTAAAQTSSATSSSSTSASSSATTGSTTTGSTGSTSAAGAAQGGPGASVDPSSVTTEEQLVALIQEAYGDAGLGLHRGHQPVESVLNEVLTIGHDELHVRMDSGQNLAAVATDLGIDPQTLIDALVASWSPAIDTLLADGTLTQAEAGVAVGLLDEG